MTTPQKKAPMTKGPGSGEVPSDSQAAAARRGPAGPGRFMGGQGSEKSMDFKGSGKRLLALLRPERALLSGVLALGVLSIGCAVTGPKVLGRATDLIFAACGRPAVPGRRFQGAGRRGRAGARRRRRRPALRGRLHPGQHMDFGAIGTVLLWVLAIYVASAAFGIVQGLLRHQGDPAGQLPAAPGRRVQARPAAAQLLRQAAPRRGAQPGHQRHRQHRPVHAADHGPGGELTAHRGRRARHDVLDLPAARPDRPDLRPAVGRGGDQGRQAGAAAVRPAVEVHRAAERAHRGDVHRPRPGEGLRPARRSPPRPSGSTTRRCTRPASGPSSSPASSSPR